ncbi:hypothetical protein [Streptomyces sp. NPDC005423]|uniref:hypothetical protein n=1 Tax=Streptomyces sp. NPDC005423 TaxID=3155343 RepID=UPI00339DDAD3
MRRLAKGAPLRDAMRASGLDIPRLAARTREIDTEGAGLSKAYVGFITGAGKTAREDCSDRAAELIALALGREVADLFEPTSFPLQDSTFTCKPRIRKAGLKPLPGQLMDQRELAAFLRKSMSWIDQQIQQWALEHDPADPWPGLHYVGRSRRFDPQAVLEGQRQQRVA